MLDDRVILHMPLLSYAIACFCFFFGAFRSRRSIVFQRMYNIISYHTPVKMQKARKLPVAEKELNIWTHFSLEAKYAGIIKKKLFLSISCTLCCVVYSLRLDRDPCICQNLGPSELESREGEALCGKPAPEWGDVTGAFISKSTKREQLCFTPESCVCKIIILCFSFVRYFQLPTVHTHLHAPLILVSSTP